MTRRREETHESSILPPQPTVAARVQQPFDELGIGVAEADLRTDVIWPLA